MRLLLERFRPTASYTYEAGSDNLAVTACRRRAGGYATDPECVPGGDRQALQ